MKEMKTCFMKEIEFSDLDFYVRYTSGSNVIEGSYSLRLIGHCFI